MAENTQLSYHKPELTEFGEARNLTQAGYTGSTPDGSSCIATDDATAHDAISFSCPGSI